LQATTFHVAPELIRLLLAIEANRANSGRRNFRI
jgi:hypothetical protein